jgi:3D-(3,5/4)-trihydroxycyclohexane-1,2-dione acylhydrolase (decyclizing)
LGAQAEHVADIAALETAIRTARTVRGVKVIVIETEATPGTSEGGAWWDVAVPEVSNSPRVRAARQAYERKLSELKDPLE